MTHEKLILPDLRLPFPTKRHPCTEEVERAMLAFLDAHGLFEQQVVPDDWRLARFGELAGLVAPGATRTGVQIVADYLGWVFFFDDLLADTGILGRCPGELARIGIWVRERMEFPTGRDSDALAREVTATLPPRVRQASLALADIAADIARRVLEHGGPGPHMRLVQACTNYLLGTVWEAAHHRRDAWCHLAEFVAGRRSVGGNEMILALLDVAAGYELPNREYHHPAMRELFRCHCDIVHWTDDITGVGRDRDEHPCKVLSLPLVIADDWRTTAQTALDEAGRRYRREVERYLGLEEGILRWAGPETRRFLGQCRDSLAGFHVWLTSSRRYGIDRYFEVPAARSA